MTATRKYDPNFNELVGTGIYYDTGCELSPSCLNCELEVCRHDTAFGIQQLANQKRDRLIRAEKGTPLLTLAARWAISERTVSRILSGR